MKSGIDVPATVSGPAAFGAGYTVPAIEPVHSRGFPGWGPPTLCGRDGRVPEVCGFITCESCLDLLDNVEALGARAKALEAEIGTPVAPAVQAIVCACQNAGDRVKQEREGAL